MSLTCYYVRLMPPDVMYMSVKGCVQGVGSIVNVYSVCTDEGVTVHRL